MRTLFVLLTAFGVTGLLAACSSTTAHRVGPSVSDRVKTMEEMASVSTGGLEHNASISESELAREADRIDEAHFSNRGTIMRQAYGGVSEGQPALDDMDAVARGDDEISESQE